MKKMVALILAVFLALSLIACGSAVPDSGTDTVSPATKQDGTREADFPEQ